MDYLTCIAKHYPTTFVECFGDSSNYEDIDWVGGDPMPSQEELEMHHYEEHRLAKIEQLSRECNQSIISGFISDALGEPHMYDSDELDQLNLIGSVANTAPIEGYPDGLSAPFAVRPIINGVLQVQPKIYVMHTYAQFRKATADGVTVKLIKLQHFNDLRTYIQLQNPPMEVLEALTFSSPVPE